jgi:hypothetical protein
MYPSGIYISEVHPNPEGEDINNLNEETVIIEMHKPSTQDLSGYQLEYGERYVYTFSDNVSDVNQREMLVIHAGKGNYEFIENSKKYHIYVGSESPLLSNNGMQLNIRDPDGFAIDSITYSSFEDGRGYYRPE